MPENEPKNKLLLLPLPFSLLVNHPADHSSQLLKNPREKNRQRRQSKDLEEKRGEKYTHMASKGLVARDESGNDACF